MARIGIAGFLHETNTFASDITIFEHFAQADAWPGLITGAQLLSDTRDMNLAVSGFISAVDQTRHTLVPLLWCSANPSGPVEQAAFETIAAQIETRLDRHGPIDALFLDLHGAMVTQRHQDAEGVLLARLRARLGTRLPIVAALDFHANLSAAMVRHASGLLAYRTYPHVDMAQTGRRAAHFLQRLLAGRAPACAFRQVPYLIPMPWQTTLAEPMASIMASTQSMDEPGIWDAVITPGFPLADVADSGPGILVYADTQAMADAAAQTLYDQMRQARARFSGTLHSIEQAMDRVLRRQPGETLILADTQDNPGGGGAGDTTDILHALHRHQARDVCAGIVCDPVFADAACAAGAGGTIDTALGGASGVGAPALPGRFQVVATGNGQFTGTGPFYLGCRMDLGPMALVRLEGLDIVVSSRKQQAADQAMFRHVGADPAAYRVLVLKSSVHFRADFAGLADDILVVGAPGVNTADLHALRYRRLRPGMAIL